MDKLKKRAERFGTVSRYELINDCQQMIFKGNLFCGEKCSIVRGYQEKTRKIWGCSQERAQGLSILINYLM